jgi:hypothetical protein
MRKARAFSAGSVVRGTALGAALCASVVGPGCTRQSFNLLPLEAAGASAGGAAAFVPSAGATDISGAAGRDELDAGAGKGGGIRSGFGGFHAFGGASATQGGGGASQEPCLSGDQCTDGGLNCPPTVGSCKRCTMDSECDGNDYCDVQDGRCAECHAHGDDCAAGDICHPLTLRCERACKSAADCIDHDRPLCDPFGACVSCNEAADCKALTGRPNDVCVFGACAECYEDKQCPMERPYCVGLQCQTKR